jgi:hypothetical protein
MKIKFALPFAVALLVAGCVPTTKYNWGNYSQSLYDYQRDATAQAAYLATLENIVASEGPSRKVPPGIFAELGYVKLASGDAKGAISLFEREKSNWPESTLMMDKAIFSARGNKEKTPAESGVTPVSLPTS